MPEWPSDEDFKAKIETLRSRAAGRQFDCNFRLDIRLSDAAIADFIQAIHGADNDFDDIHHRLTEAARKHVNEEEIVALSETKVLGRAVPARTFEMHLVYELKITRRAAKDNVRKYVRQPLTKVKDWLGSCWLSPKDRIMWSTFDPDCSDNPFANRMEVPVKIRAQLGMFKKEERSALILLYYKLPSGVKPHYPTTADAYAGTHWAAYWRPANSDDKWGLTQPWDSHPNVEPRPEVVHDPIQSTQLHKPWKICGGY